MSPMLPPPRGVGRLLFALILAPLLAGPRLQAGDTNLDEAIRRHRMGTLRIEAAQGVKVHVEQLRHEFWFGAALAGSAFNGQLPAATRDRYFEVFLQNFNAAVPETALKWKVMEADVRGRVDYQVVDALLAWADRNKIPVRGHSIFWGIPQYVPAWQKALGDADLREVVQGRALGIGKRYRGRFTEYDLNNEMLHANYYEERLGPEITRDMTGWVREGDPKAVFFLNDYDILNGRLVEEYIVHIRKFLDQGVPFGGIGVQGHMHGDAFDPVALQSALDRLAGLKLPIRVTEFNFPGQRSKYFDQPGAQLSEAEEQAKAKALAQYYRICFAHPSVTGILMWGFWEGASWIPVSALYRRDWTPTPAAQAFRDLVFRDWWTDWHGFADAQGRCEVPVFFGEHRVTAGGRTITVQLTRAEGAREVSLLPRLSITPKGATMSIDWAGLGELQSAPTVEGPWDVLSHAANPHLASNNPAGFFRAMLP